MVKSVFHTVLTWFGAGLYLLGLCGTAQADRVVLSNGDVLHGRVISLSNGGLQFESDPLGTLTISISKMQSLRTESEMSVQLANRSEWVRGRITEHNEGIQLENAESVTPIQLHDIKALADTASDPDRFQWKGSFEAGLSGRSGNTQRSAANGRFDLEARNPAWIFKGYFHALVADQEIDGQTQRTDHEIKGGGRVQRTLNNGLTLYLQQEIERDKIEELRLRSVTNGGLGMRWLETEQWFYETRIGAGCQHERFENDATSQSVIGELASDLSYKVNDHISLTQTTTWLPSLTEGDSYRVTAETAALIYLDKAHKLYLKSGLKHDYHNQPVRQVERLDMHYFTNVGFSF